MVSVVIIMIYISFDICFICTRKIKYSLVLAKKKYYKPLSQNVCDRFEFNYLSVYSEEKETCDDIVRLIYE